MPNHPAKLSSTSLAKLTPGPLALALALAALGPGCGAQRSEPATKADTSGPRIASRTVFADELLWAFGPEVQGRVVAVSPMADDPRYSTVEGQWPESIPRLGLNPEQLLVLAPSLVIMASFSAAEYRAAVEDKLEVLLLDDFSSFDGYLLNVEKIGAAIGEPARAAQIAARFSARRAKLEAARPPKEEEPWPTVLSWGHGYVAGAHTTFDDAVQTAGFTNLAAREGIEGHQRLDTEQLVVWDPRWLVIGCGELGCEAAVSALAEQPGVRKLAAVREGRVIAIEAPYLSTTGEDMLELSARMQARLLGAGAP